MTHMRDDLFPETHSAVVRLHLSIGGETLPLSHVEPNRVILRTHASLPPQQAEVVVSVDGREHRRSVFLPDGIRSSETVVRVVESPSTHVA